MFSDKYLYHRSRQNNFKRPNRKGSIIVFAAILMVFMVALLAFSIDIGYLLTARTEMQRSADAAALAGAWAMVNDDVLRDDNGAMLDYEARYEAAEFASLNNVIKTSPSLKTYGDILVGYLENPSDKSEQLSFNDSHGANTVQVYLRYGDNDNKPVSFFFAPILGVNSANLTVTAAATFSSNNTVGFRVTDQTGNSSLMPFTIKDEDWRNLLDGGGNDNWSYDPETGTVSPGPDGISEMSMFPEKTKNNKGKGKGSGITPGNFGTVDIGNNNNAAPDLWRQIREGPSAADMSYYPNHELKLDSETGKLYLNGDTGITASMKCALADIKGDPRTIFLYNDVSGQGNNTWFTIVGFAGMRVMDYSLTGKNKYIIIQPSIVVDPTAVVGDSGDTSYFIGPPVRLVR